MTYCNDPNAVAFAKGHYTDAAKLAGSIQMPAEFILGLSASETRWGQSRFATECNNFFSMETANPDAIIKFATGYSVASGTIHNKNPTRVAIYPNFYISGLSFIDRWGKYIFGISTSEAFALALEQNNFNTGDPRTGGTATFVSDVIGAIKAAKARLACPD